MHYTYQSVIIWHHFYVMPSQPSNKWHGVSLFIFGHAGSSLQRARFFFAALGLNCTVLCRLLVLLPGIKPAYPALEGKFFFYRVDNLIRWRKDLVCKTVRQNYSWPSFSLHCGKANSQPLNHREVPMSFFLLFFFSASHSTWPSLNAQ